ncbi:MAG: hypothetical protein R3F60_07590 [bacterium]
MVDNDPAVDMEAVAAVAPLAGHHHDADSGLLRLVTRGEPLRVWPLELDGASYFLAAVGGTEKAPADAPTALARILLRPSVLALSA